METLMTRTMRGTVLALVGFAAAPAQAQDSVTTSALVPIYWSVIPSLHLVQGSVALSKDAADATAAASESLRKVAAVVVVSASVVGEVTTIILRDAATFTTWSLTLPLRALDGRVPKAGSLVRVAPSEAGIILDRDGRVLAFIAAPHRDHLLRGRAIR
jgi:hypothetical protein